jgi:hypothetical protein
MTDGPNPAFVPAASSHSTVSRPSGLQSGVKFTPGPWIADRDTPHNVMPRVHGGDGSLVCEVGNMTAEQDQWEANARLIAEAPNLFLRLESAGDMLRIAHELLEASDAVGGTTDAVRLEYIRVDAALAKARGLENLVPELAGTDYAEDARPRLDNEADGQSRTQTEDASRATEGATGSQSREGARLSEADAANTTGPESAGQALPAANQEDWRTLLGRLFAAQKRACVMGGTPISERLRRAAEGIERGYPYKIAAALCHDAKAAIEELYDALETLVGLFGLRDLNGELSQPEFQRPEARDAMSALAKARGEQ